MIQWIAQGIGAIGSALAIGSFQLRGRRLFLAQTIAAVFFTVHFCILGAFAGMAQNGLGIVRNALLSVEGKKWASHPAWFWGLNGAYLVCGVIFWQNWLSLLPVLAMIVSTAAMWTKKGKIIRITQLFCISPLWLTYNISAGSIPCVLTELFNMTSVIVSLVRFGWKGLDLPAEPAKAE